MTCSNQNIGKMCMCISIHLQPSKQSHYSPLPSCQAYCFSPFGHEAEKYFLLSRHQVKLDHQQTSRLSATWIFGPYQASEHLHPILHSPTWFVLQHVEEETTMKSAQGIMQFEKGFLAILVNVLSFFVTAGVTQMINGSANCNQGLSTLSDHLWRFNILQTTGTFFYTRECEGKLFSFDSICDTPI